MKNLILSFLLLICAGCATGPFAGHETARTVGDSNHEIMGGYGQAGYVLKWNAGFSNNFDIGIQLESLSLGVRAKYAFVNNNEMGWSMATAFGTGFSIGGSHYYGDIIGSYLTGAFEPYTSLRLVHVKNDPLEFKNKDTGEVSFTIDRSEYDYGQLFLGSRYWLSKNWMISAEISKIFSVSNVITTGNGFIFGAAMGWKF